jgi:hypothetical protein
MLRGVYCTVATVQLLSVDLDLVPVLDRIYNQT